MIGANRTVWMVAVSTPANRQFRRARVPRVSGVSVNRGIFGEGVECGGEPRLNMRAQMCDFRFEGGRDPATSIAFRV